MDHLGTTHHSTYFRQRHTEQLIRNQQVSGSSPLVGSILLPENKQLSVLRILRSVRLPFLWTLYGHSESLSAQVLRCEVWSLPALAKDQKSVLAAGRHGFTSPRGHVLLYQVEIRGETRRAVCAHLRPPFTDPQEPRTNTPGGSGFGGSTRSGHSETRKNVEKYSTETCPVSLVRAYRTLRPRVSQQFRNSVE